MMQLFKVFVYNALNCNFLIDFNAIKEVLASSYSAFLIFTGFCLVSKTSLISIRLLFSLIQ